MDFNLQILYFRMKPAILILCLLGAAYANPVSTAVNNLKKHLNGFPIHLQRVKIFLSWITISQILHKMAMEMIQHASNSVSDADFNLKRFCVNFKE